MFDHSIDQSPENELNRLWNDLLEGRRDQHGYALNTDVIQDLTHLHMRGTSALPGPARERAWRETLSRIEVSPQQEGASMQSLAVMPDVAGLKSPNGHVKRPEVTRPVIEPRQSLRHRRPLIAAAAVAVFLLASAFAGYVIFGPTDKGRDPQPLIPAAVMSDATPSPDAPSATLLLRTVLPDGVMATGEQVGSGLVHYSMRVTSYPTMWFPYCCSAPLIEYVIDGVYTVQAQEPIQVIRSDGTVEDIPSNVEVVLEAGDGLVSNVATIVELSNPGPDTVELLNWAIVGDAVENEDFNGRQPMGWTEISFDGFVFSNPPSPALVSLWKVTLQPDEVWTPPAGATVFRVTLPFNDEGTPTAIGSTTKSEEGVITNGGREAVDVYVLTLEPA